MFVQLEIVVFEILILASFSTLIPFCGPVILQYEIVEKATGLTTTPIFVEELNSRDNLDVLDNPKTLELPSRTSPAPLVKTILLLSVPYFIYHRFLLLCLLLHSMFR